LKRVVALLASADRCYDPCLVASSTVTKHAPSADSIQAIYRLNRGFAMSGVARDNRSSVRRLRAVLDWSRDAM